MIDNSETLSSFGIGGGVSPQAPPPFFGREQWTPIDYPITRKVTKKHIDYVKEHVPQMMKRSAEFMATKRELIELCLDLKDNRRELSDWRPNCWTQTLAKFEDYVTSYRQRLHRADDEGGPDWRSDFTVAVQPIIDTYRESFIQSIFLQDDYFKVSPGPRNATGSVEDGQFPTADKIQSKLISSCDDMLIRSNLDLGVSDGVTVGTLVGKTPWYEQTRTEPGVNQWNEVEFRPQIIRHGTIFNPLDLTRVLVDPEGSGDDCQRWKFIGDRSDVSWDVAKSRFETKDRSGPYNLGYKEFLQKWPESGDSYYQRHDGFVKDDPDRSGISDDPVGILQAWELHCRLHFDGDPRPTECVVTYLTDANTDDPSGGILVRLQLEPATKIGLRPYCVWHFIRQSGPLGMGAVELNLDMIWMLSHAVNLFLDACRFVSIPLVKAQATSELAQQAASSAGGASVWPGKVLTWESDPNDVAPFWFQADLGPLLQLISYLDAALERRTAVSNASRGVPAPQRQTATEVATLAQHAAQPLAAKMALFREAVLNPFARIAISNLQTHVFEDQTIFIQGADGKPVPTTLTVEELRTGEYNVKAVVNLPDQMKISRAQTIIQILPLLQQAAPMLLVQENINVKLSGLYEALLKLLDIPEMANVLERVDDMTKMQIIMQMQGGAPPQGQLPGEMPPTDPSQMPQENMNGPAGGDDDVNQLMMMLQMAAQSEGQVPTGQQMGAA